MPGPHAVPVMNWGRWVADCPDPACPNVEHHGPDPFNPVDPHIGGLLEDRFECSFCKRTFSVEWPKERASVEAAVMVRPVPSTRNWFPGETVAMLHAENVEHLKVGV